MPVKGLQSHPAVGSPACGSGHAGHRVDQRDKVRGDLNPEKIRAESASRSLSGQGKHFFKIFNRIQAVAELPAPVIPFFIRHILVNGRPARGQQK
jgi:hypothetical protein